jgi:arginase family enzyme
LKDVILHLHQNNVIPVIIGGSQDLTISSYWAFRQIKSTLSITSVDSRFDFQPMDNPYGSYSYLNKILEDQEKIFEFTNLGYQTYFVSQEELKYINNMGYQAKRLGMVQQDIPRMEPILRDTDFMSVDISAVRHSDAPGYFAPSPHGFYGEQLCQIARYAGLSPRLKSLGIYEINPAHDINQLTSNLAAQVIWYFIDGFSQRNDEIPGKNNNIKKFIVSLNNNDKIVFYRSEVTERWWIEIPIIKESGEKRYISCSPEDYEKTCNREIPDIWIRFFNKLN